MERRRAIAGALGGRTDQAVSVALSPDGATLASSSQDGTVRFWDDAGRRPIGQPLDAHADLVGNVTFSPDDGALAYSAATAIVVIPFWRDDTPEAKTRLCAAAGRDWTRTEWSEFLPDTEYRESCPR